MIIKARVLLASALCGGFLSAFAATESLDAIVAWVDRSIITQSELDQRLTQIQLEHPETRNARGAQAEALRNQVLNHLITERVQLQRAEETGIRIDDVAVNAAIQKIADSNGISVAQLKEDVEHKGISYPQFRAQIHDELVLSKLYQRDIMSTITISEQELQHHMVSPDFQQSVGLEYQLRHILIPIAGKGAAAEREAEHQARVLLEELEAGAEFTELARLHSQGAQARQGGDMGWKKASEVPSLFMEAFKNIPSSGIVGPLHNSAGFHLVQVADRRMANMPVEVYLRELRFQTEAEAIAARKKDFDVQSNVDLGWSTLEDLPPHITNALVDLKAGHVTAPINAGQEWQLLQLVDRRPVANVEQVLRRYAQRDLQHRKFDEKLATWVAQLRAESYVVVVKDEDDVRANAG